MPAADKTYTKFSWVKFTNLHVQGVRSGGVAGDGTAHVGRGGAGEGGVAGALRVDVVRRRFPLRSTRGEEVSELSFVSSWIQFWPCCGMPSVRVQNPNKEAYLPLYNVVMMSTGHWNKSRNH